MCAFKSAAHGAFSLVTLSPPSPLPCANNLTQITLLLLLITF